MQFVLSKRSPKYLDYIRTVHFWTAVKPGPTKFTPKRIWKMKAENHKKAETWNVIQLYQRETRFPHINQLIWCLRNSSNFKNYMPAWTHNPGKKRSSNFLASVSHIVSMPRNLKKIASNTSLNPNIHRWEWFCFNTTHISPSMITKKACHLSKLDLTISD